MKQVLVEVLEKTSASVGSLGGALAAFKEVLATDSTVIRLHDLLLRVFPACRTNHTLAALKLHTVMSVAGRGPRSLKVTSERVHDGPVLRAGRWVEGKLLLFDLGYYRFQIFACIDRGKGFFISRLKDGANPVITAVHRTWRGASVPLLGQRLQDVIAKLQREELDVEVELRFKRRGYAGKRSTDTQRFRRDLKVKAGQGQGRSRLPRPRPPW